MRIRTFTALAGSLLLAGSLAGCSSESQGDAESAVCTSIAEVKTAAAGVKALNSTSTIDDVNSATTALAKAITGLEANSADLKQADVTALQGAGSDIQSAVAGVSGNDTLGEAATTVEASTAALDSAVTEIENGVQCS